MPRDDSTLLYAVRGRVVLRLMGDVALGSGLLAIAPLVASVWFGESAYTIRLTAVVLVLVPTGLGLRRLPTPARLQRNEALVVVVLAFLFNAAVMTVPLAAGSLSIQDAFFEAVSAVTTTGLSTVASPASAERSFVLMRAWMQWYGGLGVVIFSVALFSGHRAVMRRLVEASAADEEILATTRTHARRVLVVYSALTILAVGVAVTILDDLVAAFAFALSAVSTGGFAPLDGSLASVPTAPAALIMALAFLGAVSLPLYHRALAGGPRVLFADPELLALLGASVTTSLGLAWFLYLGDAMSVGAALRDGALVGVSAQTGTGFSTLDISTLGAAPMLWLIGAMLAGGCVGSTSGGVKLLRLLVLLELLRSVLRRSAAPPHAVLRPQLAGRNLDADDFIQALLLTSLVAGVVLVSWLVFLSAGYAPLEALFEVVSATATVGLSTGIVSGELATSLKLLLCLDMIAGRVEIVALLILLYPPTWIGTRSGER